MFLEEAEVLYPLLPVYISAGDQFKPEFLAISPNNRMPAIIDTAPADGGLPISIFESGAILPYLVEKCDRLQSPEIRERQATLLWLFWQLGGPRPRAHWGPEPSFRSPCSKKIPYAIHRYVKETNRLYGVLDRRAEEVRIR